MTAPQTVFLRGCSQALAVTFRTKNIALLRNAWHTEASMRLERSSSLLPQAAALAGIVSLALLGSGVQGAASGNSARSQLVYLGADGKLVYKADGDKGDTIPDFSNCGYGGGGVRLPDVAVKETVQPAASGDDTARIQQAIDRVAQLPVGPDGFRGAVLLAKGRYRLGHSIKIAASGIVLRGAGQEENGTLLVATGKKEYALIEVVGNGRLSEVKGTRQKITAAYVPVGARSFAVADGSKFKPGNTVIVSRHSNAAWIHELAMDRIPVRSSGNTVQWKPFSLDSDRVITAVAGNVVTVDAPLTCSIDERWGGGEIWRYDDPGRIECVGVENLRADSEFDKSVTAKERNETYCSDEKHATYIVTFRLVKNAWARNLTATHFYHGVAYMESGAKWVTVQDSSSYDPVSVITGGRRYPFNMDSQLCLVQRCYSRGARHAFAVGGSRLPGPNVFLDCRSEKDYAMSEPHQRWSTGGLYDNVRGKISFQDRGNMGSGHGWAGANYVMWNCQGDLICQQPPTAHNWSIGCVGEKLKPAYAGRKDAQWESFGRPVAPRSLYLQQLEDRLGKQAVLNIAK